MDLIEGIETRCSTRAFKDTPIPEKALSNILKAAAKQQPEAFTRWYR